MIGSDTSESTSERILSGSFALVSLPTRGRSSGGLDGCMGWSDVTKCLELVVSLWTEDLRKM